MAKTKTITDAELVDAHIKKLPTDLGKIVETLRQIILSTDKEISEHIKWNSPAFYFSGEMKAFDPKEYKRDIVVMNLHRGNVLLVFPTGAKVKNTTGLLEGAYPDGRRIVKINDLREAKSKEKDLIKVLKQWLALVEK